MEEPVGSMAEAAFAEVGAFTVVDLTVADFTAVAVDSTVEAAMPEVGMVAGIANADY